MAVTVTYSCTVRVPAGFCSLSSKGSRSNMYGHMRRRIVIVVSVCIAMPFWFASRHAIHVAPPPCPPADLLLSNGLQLELEKALLRRKRALAGATAGGTLNASSWRLREAAWRDAAELAERARYHTLA